MQTLVLLVAVFSLHLSARAEVMHDFKQCLHFFYKETVPALGTSQANARICQRLENRYHFATLYDKAHRIAVYSAYIFMNPSEEGRSDECKNQWCIEPQLVDKTWENDMTEEGTLNVRHPGVGLGANQALDEDYKGSGYDRGHLNPNLHNTGLSKQATYTLTNIVPQTPNLNQKVWEPYERRLITSFEKCTKAFVLVGAIPSDKWLNNRVNIPKLVWNAYCCVDNNDKPVESKGAIVRYDNEELQEYDDLKKMKRDMKLDPDLILFDNHCQKKKKVEE